MLEPSQLACLRKRKLLLRQPAQATRNASSVSSVRRITNWIFVLSFQKNPLPKEKSFLKPMHFAGDASSSAICVKNVEEGGHVISVTADIPPHYMTMQQLNGTRKISPQIRKIVKQVARITDQLTPYKEDLDVSSVLGIKCARAIKPREVIPGNKDDPYAQRTALIWGSSGWQSSVDGIAKGGCSSHSLM